MCIKVKEGGGKKKNDVLMLNNGDRYYLKLYFIFSFSFLSFFFHSKYAGLEIGRVFITDLSFLGPHKGIFRSLVHVSKGVKCSVLFYIFRSCK